MSLGTILDKIIWHDQNDNFLVFKNKVEAKQQIFQDLMEIIGEDEEIPMENRMSDIEQVRLFNQVSKAVYGRNALRAELRTKIKEYVGIE